MPGYKRKRSYSRFRRRFRRYSRPSRRFSRYRRTYTRKPRSIRARVRAIEKSIEYKYADSTQVMTSIGVNFTGTHLLPDLDSGTGTGTPANDRIGDTVNLRYLQARIAMDVGDTTNVVRLIVVCFPTLSGTTGISDVLQYPSVILGDSRLPIQSLYKKDSAVKFKVLYDKVHSVNSTTKGVKIINLKIPLPKTGLKLTYADGTSVQPEKNIINIYAASDSTVAPNPGIVGNTRATYNDA